MSSDWGPGVHVSESVINCKIKHESKRIIDSRGRIGGRHAWWLLSGAELNLPSGGGGTSNCPPALHIVSDDGRSRSGSRLVTTTQFGRSLPRRDFEVLRDSSVYISLLPLKSIFACYPAVRLGELQYTARKGQAWCWTVCRHLRMISINTKLNTHV
jgi:hypothetical protein